MSLPGFSGPEDVRWCWAGLREPAGPLHLTILTQHHLGAARHGYGHRCFQRKENNCCAWVSSTVGCVNTFIHYPRWPQPSRMGACSQRSPSALRFSPVAIWLPTWPRQGQEQAGTLRTARCFNTWCSWSKAQHRAPWWQVRVKATRIILLQLVEAALVQLMRSTLQMFLWLKVLLRIL